MGVKEAQMEPPMTTHTAGLLFAFLLGWCFPLQDRDTGQCTPAKHALPEPCLLAALWLAEPPHGRGEGAATAPGHAGVEGRGRRTPSLPQALGSPMYFLINV